MQGWRANRALTVLLTIGGVSRMMMLLENDRIGQVGMATEFY